MRSIQSRRLWLVVIISLALVAVVLVAGNQSFKAIERAAFDEFNQRQLVLAREAAGGIKLYFETLAGDLRALGRMPEVQRFDEAGTRRETQRTFDKLEPLGVNDVGVLDAAGVLRYSATAPQIEGEDFSWRRYYQEARQLPSSDTYVVEFIEFRGAEAGQKGVLVAVPLFATAVTEDDSAPSGRFSGVVLCTLRLDTITQRFVAPIRSSERGHALLIDDESNVLWAPDRSLFAKNLVDEAEGFPTLQQIVVKMSSGSSGAAEYSYYAFDDSIGEYTTGRTEEKLIAYVPIQLGMEVWAIGVWAPKADARQLIRTAYVRQLYVVGLSVLIIVLGSAYALAISLRTAKLLEKDVEAKTGELRESRDRLITALGDLEAVHAFQQSVIDGVADPIMHIATDYHVRMMNRAARDFSSEGDGTSGPLLCYQISHRRETPCDGTEHPCPLQQVREAGQPATVIHEHYQADGERRVVEVIASPLWGKDGAFQGIIESARDITERKRAEEAQRQSEEQLRLLNEQLEDYARNLQQKVVERTREIEQRRHVAESLRGVLAILNTSRPLEGVLDFIVAEASRLLGSDTNAIYRLDGTDGAFTIQTIQGAYTESVVNLEPPPILLHALREGEPVAISDVTGAVPETQIQDLQHTSSLEYLADCCRALLAVPLIAAEEPYGGLVLYYSEPRMFSDDEIELAVAFGGQAALAIENARLRHRAERAAAVEERGRLARELHDSVTQSLYSLTLLAEAGQRMIGARDLQQAEGNQARLGEIAQQALQEMRLMVYELRPLALGTEGLLPALEQRLETVERRAGVETRLVVEGVCDLPLAEQDELYHITREALNNSLKHASASAVAVTIHVEGGYVALEVTDDGQGFDPDTVSDKGGLGLIGMQERAEKIGASLTIQSVPGKGTRVRVTTFPQASMIPPIDAQGLSSYPEVSQ